MALSVNSLIEVLKIFGIAFGGKSYASDFHRKGLVFVAVVEQLEENTKNGCCIIPNVTTVISIKI